MPAIGKKYINAIKPITLLNLVDKAEESDKPVLEGLLKSVFRTRKNYRRNRNSNRKQTHQKFKNSKNAFILYQTLGRNVYACERRFRFAVFYKKRLFKPCGNCAQTEYFNVNRKHRFHAFIYGTFAKRCFTFTGDNNQRTSLPVPPKTSGIICTIIVITENMIIRISTATLAASKSPPVRERTIAAIEIAIESKRTKSLKRMV